MTPWGDGLLDKIHLLSNVLCQDIRWDTGAGGKNFRSF